MQREFPKRERKNRSSTGIGNKSRNKKRTEACGRVPHNSRAVCARCGDFCRGALIPQAPERASNSLSMDSYQGTPSGVPKGTADQRGFSRGGIARHPESSRKPALFIASRGACPELKAKESPAQPPHPLIERQPRANVHNRSRQSEVTPVRLPLTFVLNGHLKIARRF